MNLGLSPEKVAELKRDIRNSILKVLLNDSRAMPLSILMHKVFQDIKPKYSSIYIDQKHFMLVLDELKKSYLVGKNNFNKYFIDYLDYQEKNVYGEGFLEVDPITGNGYITVKKSFNEHKKSSHFVHKKNLNNAKHGDYVKFVELEVTNMKHFDKFALIDAKIKEILPKPLKK